jgi:pimeloyl-ACP methyl ester carboxylesterase
LEILNPQKGAWEVLVKTPAKKANGDQGLDLYLNVLFPKEYMETVVQQDTMLKSHLREKLRNCHRLPREQAPIPFMGHFYAATMHRCPYPKLQKIATDLKPAKILVITGGSDELIPSKRSLELHKNLPGSELVVLEDAGHALIFQLSEEFNTIMERAILEGNQAFRLLS